MAERNEELRELYRLLSRQAELQAAATSLRQKRQMLTPEVKRLKRDATAEQRDADRLTRPTIAALVCHLSGNLENRRESERLEAAQAIAKYHSAARELADIEARLDDTEALLADMEDRRRRYHQLLAQKQAAIKAAGGADADKILGKERTLSFLDSQLHSIREALAAGKAAWNAVGSVLSKLDAAALQTCLRPGKGIVNDLVAMRNDLPEAQSAIYSLEPHITAFEKKLALTSIRGRLNFRPEEIDVWKPGPITVAAVSGVRIKSGKDSLEALQQRISLLLEQLRREEEQIQRKQQKTRDSLEKMTLSMDWSE